MDSEVGPCLHGTVLCCLEQGHKPVWLVTAKELAPFTDERPSWNAQAVDDWQWRPERNLLCSTREMQGGIRQKAFHQLSSDLDLRSVFNVPKRLQGKVNFLGSKKAEDLFKELK